MCLCKLSLVSKRWTKRLGCLSATQGPVRPCLLAGMLVPPVAIAVSQSSPIGSHTYTWLNSHKEPIKVPAVQYIELVQRWINGKLNDPRAFPTDNITSTAHTYASGGLNTPSANTPIAMGPTTSTAPLSTLAGHDWVGKSVGFQENFYHDCKNIMRQIFRIYAHVYHAHWIDPFWHISTNSLGWPDLNSCFVHFICVAKLFGLLTEKDMEPMAPLIEIWIANGSIPPDAASGACTIVQTQ